MYLGMTETEYQNILDSTPRTVAERLGIGLDKINQPNLEEQIKQYDSTAYQLMSNFMQSYQQWWQMSNALEEHDPPDSSKRSELLQLIDQRDEIRRALINYLNYKQHSHS